jgi:hypothetical protein
LDVAICSNHFFPFKNNIFSHWRDLTHIFVLINLLEIKGIVGFFLNKKIMYCPTIFKGNKFLGVSASLKYFGRETKLLVIYQRRFLN